MHLIQIIMSLILHYGEMKSLIYLAALYLQKVSTVEQAEYSIKNRHPNQKLALMQTRNNSFWAGKLERE